MKARSTTNRWIWPVTVAILGLYAAAYACMIHGYRAIPYWDQSNYITKTYNLAEEWNKVGVTWHSALRRLDPRLYLGAQPQERPPLMMAGPAALWGTAATPHQMAYWWLAGRVLFLLLGAWLLARTFGDATWVPAALAFICGSQLFLKLNQNLYMMDAPFAAAALLFAAVAGYALVRRATLPFALTCLAFLGLLLIKPQGLVFALPFMAVLCVDKVWNTIALCKRPLPSDVAPVSLRRDTVSWLAVGIVTVLVLVYLLYSPYWSSVRVQYTLGARGFWSASHDWSALWFILTGLLPPWLFLAGGLRGVVRQLWMSSRESPANPDQTDAKSVRMHPRLICLFAAGIISWLIFSVAIAYAIDPRVVWAIAPLTISLACIWICRHPLVARITTALAILQFLLMLSIASLGWPFHSLNTQLLGPCMEYQPRFAEVGLRELAAGIHREVHAGNVLVLMSHEFVERGALALAARWENADCWSSVEFSSVPLGSDGIDLDAIFRHEFFLVADPNAPLWPDPLGPAAMLNQHAVEQLITAPISPLHDLFEIRLTATLHVPLVAETSTVPNPDAGIIVERPVLLYHLKRTPTTDELRRAAAFLIEVYRGTPGEAAMRAQAK